MVATKSTLRREGVCLSQSWLCCVGVWLCGCVGVSVCVRTVWVYVCTVSLLPHTPHSTHPTLDVALSHTACLPPLCLCRALLAAVTAHCRMLELGGIRSQRQSRQRPLPATHRTVASTATATSTSTSSTSFPPPHVPFSLSSASHSASTASVSSRKRPLPAGPSTGPLSVDERPSARIKLERGRDDNAGNNREVGGRLQSGPRRRECDRIPAAVTVPFVCIRVVRQQSRLRLEERERAGQAEAASAESVTGAGQSGVDERPSAVRRVSIDDGRSLIPTAAPSASSVVVLEALSVRRPAALSSSLSPSSPPHSNRPVNFKRFHKASLPLPSPSRPARSLLVSDSGDGCRAAVEVEAVRHAEHIERLTAQMDASSSGSRTSVTGKRKR